MTRARNRGASGARCPRGCDRGREIWKRRRRGTAPRTARAPPPKKLSEASAARTTSADGGRACERFAVAPLPRGAPDAGEQGASVRDDRRAGGEEGREEDETRRKGGEGSRSRRKKNANDATRHPPWESSARGRGARA
jgi:hypothetical protein